jgi:DEAD/DEAH box helicase domain-containing protein
MDTLVFDVETSNFFTDPGVGWNNFDALHVSTVGVYSYAESRYACFDEPELPALAEMMRNARLLVGFSINRYDIPVLQAHFDRLKLGLNLYAKDRLDLLDEIEVTAGRRISLNLLAQANLGCGKLGAGGAEAGLLYREGRMEELRAYCLRDVELTKGLYELFRDRKYLMLPDRDTGDLARIDFPAVQPLF